MVSVNAIQGTLIADNAITAVHIATNAVSGTLIADNAVTATHIAQNTITVTQLADDCVESAKIADGIITTNHLNKAMISSQTEVAVATGDFVLIGDTSDSNNLKKAPISSILAGSPTGAGAFTSNVTLTSTDAGAGAAPLINFYRNSSSPADNDYLGEIIFKGRNDNSQDVNYAGLATRLLDASDGTEDGRFELYTIVAGAQNSRLLASSTETVLNEDSVDLDFRVESNGDANMLFVDGGANAVGIGTGTPATAAGISRYLHIDGGDPGIVLKDSTANDVAEIYNAAGKLIIYGGSGGTNADSYAFDIPNNRLGIGTISPLKQLHISAASPVIRLEDTDGGYAEVSGSGSNLILRADEGNSQSSSHIRFEIDDSAQMRLTTTGLGIGTITPQKAFHVEHAAGASEGILISGASDTNGHTAGILLRAEGGEGDSVLRAKGGIFFERAGTYGIGSLHLCNNNDNSNSSASLSDAVMTITDGKAIGIGTTSPTAVFQIAAGNPNNSSDAVFFVSKTGANDFTAKFGAGADDYGLHIRGSGNYAWSVFDHSNDVYRARITFGGQLLLTDTTIASISDRRLKKNIVDANSQWNDIKALKWRNFEWKEESKTETYLGLIADEVEAVSPNLVQIDAQPKEDIDAGIPDPKHKTVKYSIVWMKAMKALQEAQERIETLEAKVQALEK